jgi:flagellin
MSGIVLSASVRQNLLSLQSTAALLATTQNDLATGNRVNSALDNPTEYFTAQGLNNRASDISNLLDGINNGVQVLQAANTGITSLQSLIASAQSIANQVLQAPTGYSTKSQVTAAAVTGANANNLLGTTAANATAIEKALLTGGTSPIAATSTTSLAGTAGSLTGSAVIVNGTPSTAISASTALVGSSGVVASGGTTFAAGDTLTVNGHTITFVSSAPAAGSGFTAVTSGATANTLYTDSNGDEQIVASSATVKDVLSAIDAASGVATITTGALAGSTSTVNGSGDIVLSTTTGSDVNISASNTNDLKALGLSPSASGTVTVNRTTSATSLGTLIQAGSSLNVDGHTITFVDKLPTTPTGSGTVGSSLLTDGNGNSTIALSSGTLADVLKALDLASGVQTASISGGTATLSVTSGDTASSIDSSGKLNINTGTAQALTIAAGLSSNPGNALAALGLSAGTTSDTALQGETLNIAATPGGGTATSITFGTEAGQVSTLNELNAALAANNLQASIDTTGAITITTTNNAASETVGALSGTATATGQAFAGVTGGGLPPVADPNSQATRASLISQYNNVLAQITTTAQDSSFNGINLLNGDTLNLTFDETGESKLAVQGFTFTAANLGLSTLTVGTDFLDNNAANSVLSQLTAADTTLRTAASSLGSNLSVVQIRQDFNKNLVNVLQTGATNLTIADPNEEAANSQALSTRQSIAVSALALANQSQQSVLQLLR